MDPEEDRLPYKEIFNTRRHAWTLRRIAFPLWPCPVFLRSEGKNETSPNITRNQSLLPIRVRVRIITRYESCAAFPVPALPQSRSICRVHMTMSFETPPIRVRVGVRLGLGLG